MGPKKQKPDDESSRASKRSSPTSSLAGTARSASSGLSNAAHSVKKTFSKATAQAKSAVRKVTRSRKSKASTAGEESSVIELSGDEDDVEEPDDVDAELNDKDKLERLKSKWNSPIYGFFTSDVTIGYENGRTYHFFPCAARKCKGNAPGVKRYLDNSNRSSTSNMKKHARKCWGAAAVDSALQSKEAPTVDGSIFSAFAQQGQRPAQPTARTYTNSEVRAHLVKWITESNRPITIVEDPEFKDLMGFGRPGLDLNGRRTLARDIMGAFPLARERISNLLKGYSGKLHFSTDAWTSPNHRPFVAVHVHLQYEGAMLSFLLDFVEVPKSHTGVNLAAALEKVLKDYGIEHKALAIAMDNASSNDTQFTTLAESLNNSISADDRVRCFAHTLNLSAKALLKPFTRSLDADTTEDGQSDTDNDMPDLESVGNLDSDGDDDDEGEVDVMAEMDETARQTLLTETSDVRTTLSRVRGLAYAIVNSPTIIRPKWDEACRTHKLPLRLMPRDVKTRWNSTYDMMDFAFQYRAAIDEITSNKELKTQTRKFELDEDQWNIVQDLGTVLRAYKSATLAFSRESVSMIANVIPTMDKIDTILRSQVPVHGDDGSDIDDLEDEDTKTRPIHSAVVSATQFARKCMDKYWMKSDESDIYRIAMVLHPGMKLEYFRQTGWAGQSWIEESQNLTEIAFISYNTIEDDADGDVIMSDAQKQTDMTVDSFTNFSVTHVKGRECDELIDYLATPVESVQDPLKWWWDHRRTYPKLSRMALDYLCIPATSVGVERTFSRGRQLLSFTRNRLAPKSIQAFMCLGSWGRVNLIKVELILESINGRFSAKKRKRSNSDGVEDN